MRNYFFFFTFLFFGIGCKKDTINPISNLDPIRWGYSGQITGLLMNGNSWNMPSGWSQFALGNTRDSDNCCNCKSRILRIVSVTSDTFLREVISITHIPFKTGKFIIKGDYTICDSELIASLALNGDDGDVLVGFYNRSKNVESSITISKIDTISHDVSGTFDITFTKQDRQPGYFDNYPDIVRFSGGQFKTRWIK